MLVQRPINNWHLRLSIFPIAYAQNPRRSTLRLRFLVHKNILRGCISHLFYAVLAFFISVYIASAVKYYSILFGQISNCCVVINRCSARCSSIFGLAYEELFCVIYRDI